MADAHRRRLLVSATTLLAAAGVVGAQGTERMRKIGWLTAGSPKTHARVLTAFRAGLGERGWIGVVA